ncbi:MAG: lipoyl domain-containing protein [Planctomycetia bacterium]
MDRALPPSPRLVVPDLGMPGAAIALSLWLVPEGADVLEGDRVAELLCNAATIDLEAPVTGRLVRHLVDEDAAVTPGMAIAEFEQAAER